MQLRQLREPESVELRFHLRMPLPYP
jgi:hypothetical protein